MGRRKTPHLMAGSSLGNWVRLLTTHGFVSPRHYLRCLRITAAVLAGVPSRLYETLRFGRRVAKVELEPPVFLIGHWQSGHSALHYALAEDPQFGVTNTLHCAMPGAILTLKPLISRLLKKRLPKTRQADSLKTGLHGPQGDDMAMAALSTLSFYHAYIFPKRAEPVFRRSVLFEGVSARRRKNWMRQYRRFLQKVALDTGKSQLLVRNASHTGRIPELLQAFPGARFIHVYRNPYRMFSALMERWHGLLSLWALQKYDEAELEEHTLLFFERLMTKFFEDRKQIPDGQLAEVRYEDFEASPLETIQEIYRQLTMSGFEQAREPIHNGLQFSKGSVAGQGDLTPRQEANVTARWGFAIDEWGYTKRKPAVADGKTDDAQRRNAGTHDTLTQNTFTRSD